MKITTIILAAFLFSCCPKKAVADANTDLQNNSISSICPQDGNCTAEIQKNKQLVVKTDDFGGIYFDTLDNKDFSIIKYTYEKKVPKDLQDGHYREELIFEVKNSDKNLSLSNQDLQKVKLLFGRHCYCKGQAGYFKIISGSIISNIIQDKTEYTVSFKTTQVPQILTKVTFLIP